MARPPARFRSSRFSIDQQSLKVTFNGPELTLHVHRWRRERLVVEITESGKPVQGAQLWTDMGLGVCGAGDGIIATTDARGRAIVPEFYPEEWTFYWICYDGYTEWQSKDAERFPQRLDLDEPFEYPDYFTERCDR